MADSPIIWTREKIGKDKIYPTTKVFLGNLLKENGIKKNWIIGFRFPTEIDTNQVIVAKYRPFSNIYHIGIIAVDTRYKKIYQSLFQSEIAKEFVKWISPLANRENAQSMFQHDFTASIIDGKPLIQAA